MKTIKNSFSGGELSTDLEGRTDIAKYSTGAQLLDNFYVNRFGGVSNRPGTEYIGKTPHGVDAVNKLIPFQFSVRQAYGLEFSSRNIAYVDSFLDTELNTDYWQETITTIDASIKYGGGNVTITSNDNSTGAATVSQLTTTSLPFFGETSFSISGSMSSPDFPVGSATDVYNHKQEIAIRFGATNVLEFGFYNGSNFSASNYRGYYIERTGQATVYVDSDNFDDIAWSVVLSGGTATLTFNGTSYTFSVGSDTAEIYQMALTSTGTAPVGFTAQYGYIEDGATSGDVTRIADNVMRVIKNGGIVLKSYRSGTYKWTASGSGTSEYYCELNAGGDPSIPGAVDVYENGSLMTEGTLGSLSAGEWAWGDNDSLNYGTIYVRLSDSTDPDTKALSYIQADYQLDTGILHDQLPTMDYAQDKDTLFLAQSTMPPKKIVRSAEDNWSISNLSFTPTETAPLDFYVSRTGFVAGDRKVFYQVSAINEDLQESLPADAIEISDMDLNWPTAGRVDIYWNNITDGLESTPVFQWTQVGATNEYYLELNGGGDPSISEPSKVWEDKTEMTLGTVTSLSEGEYWYGDNDTLGFNTVYVRIVGSTDPDTKAVGYITYKTSDQDQWSVYKNYRGDWGWMGAVQTPWFLDDDVEADVSITPKVARDPFNTGDADDYPAVVAVYQQRLFYARSNNNPQRVWSSVSGDLTNFATSKPLSAEDPITVTLVSGGTVDIINHFLTLKDLFVFTDNSEWVLAPASSSDALSPFSRQFINQGYEGCSNTVKPIGIGDQAIFMQRDNREVRGARYSDERGGYPSVELNIWAKHLFEGKTVVDWCYQKNPESIVWMIMSDGTGACMTYLPEQEVLAFTRFSTNGDFVKCVSIPGTTGDDVYFIADRLDDVAPASRNRLIEKMSSRDFGNNVRDARFLDSALTYKPTVTITGVAITATEITVTATSHGYSNGDFVLIDDVEGISATGSNAEYTQFNDRYYKVANVATDTFELEDLDGVALTSTDFSGTYIRGGSVWKCTKSVSGLDHLEGKTVSVLADGQAIGTFTVSSGSITLGTEDPGYGVVHVGLGYNCDLQTLRFDLATNETIQYSRKNMKKLIFRFKKSSGGYAGPDADNLTLIKWRQDEEWLQPNELKTEDVEHVMKATWDREGKIYFRQSDPLPTTILALIMEFQLGNR